MQTSHDDAARERIFSKLGLAATYAVTYGSSPAVKHTLLAFALLASLAATGCAASGVADDDGGPSDFDSGIKADVKTDGAKQQETGTTQECVPSCSSDTDCENSCPAVPNGVNCCDTSTGICYAYASSVCPAPVQDAGFD